MTSSIVAPKFYEKQAARPMVEDPPAVHVVDLLSIDAARVEAIKPAPSAYSYGALDSFSVYAHSIGLRLAAEKSLAQLFTDIERYAPEPPTGGIDDFILRSVDLDPAIAQAWRPRSYKLNATADDSLPSFPDSDFEG